MSFIDFAEVKARCSIEQAAKLLDLKTIEERSQLRAPCPVYSGGQRAIVITPAKNLFHCFPSKARGDQIALVSRNQPVRPATSKT
jgi:DNA primase